MSPLFAIFSSPQEWLVILIVGVLLFGKRLPEIARGLGKGVVEFKKGLKGLEDDMDTHVRHDSSMSPALEQPRPPQRVPTSAPKFEEAPVPLTPPSPPQA